jgi:hypothetical protein
MISHRSQALFLLPMSFGYWILCSPAIWNQRQQKLIQSTGIWKVNYFMYDVGGTIGIIIVAGFHLQAIVSGHATNLEMITGFFLCPLYLLIITIEMNCVLNWKLAIYAVNQMLGVSAEFGNSFLGFPFHIEFRLPVYFNLLIFSSLLRLKPKPIRRSREDHHYCSHFGHGVLLLLDSIKRLLTSDKSAPFLQCQNADDWG